MARESETFVVLIESYINDAWTTLRRTTRDLFQAGSDPKLQSERPLLYISPTEDRDAVAAELDSPEMAPSIRILPHNPELWPDFSGPHGLLYLPRPYVVPGGRFNEMYGWDSYFINLGLLRQGLVQEAKDMVNNHLYQVKHYGHVLNANRTYYLSRSQPPFLADMVLDVYRQTNDIGWLASTLPELEKTYRFWTTSPHLTPETGLSRYFDLGRGPAPEVLSSERDEQGLTHYQRIALDFEQGTDEQYGYDKSLYVDSENGEPTALFYKGDRSMRESGFDPSDRFGRFNIDVVHYNPVDLNSLLYRFETTMVEILRILGEPDKETDFDRAATKRKALMEKFLWDDEAGLYFDYNFRTECKRDYPFATTFFPLWSGWANERAATKLRDKLQMFLAPGGVVTSTFQSGNQWDKPFGWAPLQLIAALGMKRYGFSSEACDIATRFTQLVESEYRRTGTILEKYDVEKFTSSVSEGIRFGYSSNEIGFGWTNAVYLELKELSSL